MSKTKNTDYLFLSAYIRAREASLLNNERLERMINAADAQEAARVLPECGYPEVSGTDDAQLDEVFAARRAEVISEIERFGPEPALVQAFRLRYDYHNAKVLIKAEAASVDGGNLLYSCGRIKPDVLLAAFNQDDWRMIPGTFAAAIRSARSTMARSGNPQLADIELDKAWFAEQLELAQTLSSDFYTEYIRLQIDTINLRCAVRCIRGRMDESVMKAALMDGGNIPVSRILGHISAGVSAVFRERALASAAELGQQAIDGAPLAAFERECDNVLQRYLEKAKLIPYGPESAVAYLTSLEGEIIAVRTILLGKRSGISPEGLRERLRDCYV